MNNSKRYYYLLVVFAILLQFVVIWHYSKKDVKSLDHQKLDKIVADQLGEHFDSNTPPFPSSDLFRPNE